MKKLPFSFFLIFSGIIAMGQKLPSDYKILESSFQLDKTHNRSEQLYYMQSQLYKFEPSGKRKAPDTYKIYLLAKAGADMDTYTCLRFTVTFGDSMEVSIPSLSGYSYQFSVTGNNQDEKGQVFGIDHSRFESLKDSSGKAIPIENTYHVYNAFIDFHAMNVFSDRTLAGHGVQDLKHIGDTIQHVASYSEPPVNLGSQIEKGSVFRNGRVTLKFKGLGFVNNQPCAVIGYDSGESSFHMLMSPMAGMRVVTDGSSHYWGDIEKSLSTYWIQHALLHELVVSQTILPGNSNKVQSVIERSIDIRNITDQLTRNIP